MDHSALRAFIDSESANDGRTDAEVLAWLNETESVVGAVGSRTLLRWGAGSARLDRLHNAASDTNNHTGAVRAIARAAELVVSRPDTELDMADAEQVGMVDALVSASVLTADDKTALVTLATYSRARWGAAVNQQPTERDVHVARGGT